MPTSRVLPFQLEAAQEAEMLAAEVAKKASSDVEMCGESGSKHTYSSLSEMLQLASLDKVCVEGDGNCGFHALHLASGGSESTTAQLSESVASTPTADDYAAQQALRAKRHSWLISWLIDQGEAVVASQLQADLEQSLTPSRCWQSDQIDTRKSWRASSVEVIEWVSIVPIQLCGQWLCSTQCPFGCC